MTSRTLLPVLLAILLTATACASDSPEVVAGPGALRHIHDLVLTNDDTLLVASHSGLYRIDAIDTAVLLGTEQHDLMSMSSDADGLLASGHPDLRLEKYYVEGHSPHLGLARTSDQGTTWTVEADILGVHDFHALVPTDSGIFGAAQESIMFREANGTWTELGELTARDLAVNPANHSLLAAADYDEQMWHSTDGGRNWTKTDQSPNLIEIEWIEPDQLIGADEAGSLWTADNPQGPWTEMPTGLPEIETLHIDGAQWWLTVHGGAIHTSTDNGATWSAVYIPPEQ